MQHWKDFAGRVRRTARASPWRRVATRSAGIFLLLALGQLLDSRQAPHQRLPLRPSGQRGAVLLESYLYLEALSRVQETAERLVRGPGTTLVEQAGSGGDDGGYDLDGEGDVQGEADGGRAGGHQEGTSTSARATFISTRMKSWSSVDSSARTW